MKIIRKTLNILIILSIAAVSASFFLKKSLPEKEQILPEARQSPIQTQNRQNDFIFNYRGTNYKVTPLADYELWGLVVSHNDISKFSDIYHNKDSVDLRDICVVWGENAKTGVYKKGKYKSGSWTCYWRFDSKDAWRLFNESEIANNHLISSEAEIQDQIRGIRIGDQIHLTGYLINYVNEDTGWRRETSLTRVDTGNRACEVVFVTNIDILKSSNAKWYLMYYWGKVFLAVLIVIKIIFIGIETHLDLKKWRNV